MRGPYEGISALIEEFAVTVWVSTEQDTSKQRRGPPSEPHLAGTPSQPELLLIGLPPGLWCFGSPNQQHTTRVGKGLKYSLYFSLGTFWLTVLLTAIVPGVKHIGTTDQNEKVWAASQIFIYVCRLWTILSVCKKTQREWIFFYIIYTSISLNKRKKINYWEIIFCEKSIKLLGLSIFEITNFEVALMF